MMDNIINFLITVKDDREPWKIKHVLSDIVLLIFFARLSGAEYWDEIEAFGQAYEATLKTVLQLENGIPSHDTLQRVFATLDPQVLVEVTQMWSDILEESDLSSRNLFSFSKRLVAIDGKTIRGNGSAKQKALHIVTAYATDLGISYGQVATNEKSNEITAIPELLDMISVKGCMVSIDAMGTQKAIADKIIKKKADYCLAVKENQKTLLEDIVPFFEMSQDADDHYHTVEKAHGQIETRAYEVIHDVSWLKKTHPEFGHIQSIGRARIHLDKNGQESEESRYFILSCQVSAKELCDYVRGHWQIESMHWLLDVVFREDANKTLNKQLAFNLNVMDKFCLAVLKRLDFGKKMSMRRKKYALSLSFDKYLKKIT
ncbi:ISAs1-like element ISSeq10 family transposase [Streptococcus equi]|nr:ISAs1-like element ISSeq10 family transposase [Streptococcus equi]